MLHFTIRDLLWLIIVVALSLMLWVEHQATRAARLEREEAVARWHAANEQWLAAIKLIPAEPRGLIGGGGMPQELKDDR